MGHLSYALQPLSLGPVLASRIKKSLPWGWCGRADWTAGSRGTNGLLLVVGVLERSPVLGQHALASPWEGAHGRDSWGLWHPETGALTPSQLEQLAPALSQAVSLALHLSWKE